MEVKLRGLESQDYTDDYKEKIEISGKSIALEKSNSKLIHMYFVSKTAEKYFASKLEKEDIEWTEVYSKIYLSTM